MKHNWTILGPFVTAARMVRDYVTELYEPAAASAHAVAADDWSLAKALAAWKAKVSRGVAGREGDRRRGRCQPGARGRPARRPSAEVALGAPDGRRRDACRCSTGRSTRPARSSARPMPSR